LAAILSEAVKPVLELNHPYEIIVILKSSIVDEDAVKIIDKIKSAVEKKSGEVVCVENMGRKKLAYEVKKEKKGLYFLIHFKGKGGMVSDIHRVCRLDESIIKFMTVRIKPSELRSTVHSENISPIEKEVNTVL
jgi:small subunit ribosomal protein S6